MQAAEDWTADTGCVAVHGVWTLLQQCACLAPVKAATQDNERQWRHPFWCSRRYTGAKKPGVDAYLAPELARCPLDCVAYTPAGRAQQPLLHVFASASQDVEQVLQQLLLGLSSSAPHTSHVLLACVPGPLPRRHVVIGRRALCAAQRQPRSVWQQGPVLDLHPQHARPARERGQAAALDRGECTPRACHQGPGACWIAAASAPSCCARLVSIPLVPTRMDLIRWCVRR